MASDGTPTVPYWSGGKLGQAVTSERGPMADLLAQNDFLYNVLEDDFRGDALRAWYPIAKTNGASAAVTFTEHNTEGFIDLITGTANNGYAGQGIGTSWNGDRGILAEFLFLTPSSLADFKFEVGLPDADNLAGAVNDKNAESVNMTDGAVLVYDSNDDSNLTLIHAKGGVVDAVDLSMTLTVSTRYYVAFRVTDDNVQVMIRGLTGTPSAEEVVSNLVASAGVEGGTDLTPWMFSQARAGSASKALRWYKWRVTEPAW